MAQDVRKNKISLCKYNRVGFFISTISTKIDIGLIFEETVIIFEGLFFNLGIG